MTQSTKNPSAPKKRAVISYDNMFPELREAFKEKYPRGYADYMADLFKVDKPDGTFFYAVSIEIPDAVYLVKIPVKVDDYEEAENDLFEDAEEEDMDNSIFPDDSEDDSAAEEPEE
ncbi:MAG TPA: hypothetical protein IAC34_07340 [Candidatus Coprenecus stercoripullorum]|nr:hypothetical protein [Candidatus Coprenecus stercoripullorum]